MIEYIGYACALIIGIIMGVSGAGGSILTVPVLVYIVGLSPVTATAYSLFIVGTTSAFGTIQNLSSKLVEIKTALLFALPSLLGVYISRKFIVPAIPDTIFESASFVLTKGTLLMVLFGIVILIAAIKMLWNDNPQKSTIKHTNKFLLIIQIFLAGVLIGLVGAGGGFLFIPLLVYVARLPMKNAVATSLLIIAINSLIGFTGDLQNLEIDWLFLLKFTCVSIVGVFVGIHVGRYINEKQLKLGFGWFVLVMAMFIFVRELFFSNPH